jgi:hypothetical protein
LQNGHAHRDPRAHLFKYKAAWTVGNVGVDLDSFVHWPWVQHQRAWCQRSKSRLG